MNKFWPAVLVLILVASGLLIYENQTYENDNDQINFVDLETECRTEQRSDIMLRPDRTLVFEGAFNTVNTHADLGYSYSNNGERISLDVTSRPDGEIDDFRNSCRASVVYIAETEPLEPGRYNVQLYHKGEEKREIVINVD